MGVRLILSAALDAASEPVDVVLDCAPGARVRDVARAVAQHTSGVQARVVPRGSGHLGVVEVQPWGQDAPPLWWRGRELDPDEPVETCPLRHGSVVGVGADPGDTWDEPLGTCEVRVVSGPGAGRVHRLGVGRHEIGSGASASVPVDGDVPPRAVVLEVGLDGSRTLHPEPSVLGVTRPAPARRRPLDGPIVVRRPDADAAPRTA
ncbi:cell division-like protein, partial [Cellulomonas septica]|nr:cell division-like protein [Cellulomonas septica]